MGYFVAADSERIARDDALYFKTGSLIFGAFGLHQVFESKITSRRDSNVVTGAIFGSIAMALYGFSHSEARSARRNDRLAQATYTLSWAVASRSELPFLLGASARTFQASGVNCRAASQWAQTIAPFALATSVSAFLYSREDANREGAWFPILVAQRDQSQVAIQFLF